MSLWMLVQAGQGQLERDKLNQVRWSAGTRGTRLTGKRSLSGHIGSLSQSRQAAIWRIGCGPSRRSRTPDARGMRVSREGFGWGDLLAVLWLVLVFYWVLAARNAPKARAVEGLGPGLASSGIML